MFLHQYFEFFYNSFWFTLCTYYVSFGMLFIHIGLVDTIGTYIFIGLNICYGQIKFCSYCFFRNMHLSDHTGGIWWFWLHIWNPLEIWSQKTYRPTYVVSLWVNPILGLKYWNIHSKGNRPDMKIPSSDPESAHQIGPDDIWFMSFRGGNPTLSWCSKLIWLEHGLRSAMKILCPDSKSPQKTSLDTG